MAETEDNARILRRSRRVPPPPPRITGDAEVDLAALRDWFQQFYQVAVIETGLLDPTFQGSSPPIDLDALPNPEFATIAQAQATANTVYRNLSLGVFQRGEFTISGTNDSATINLREGLPDDQDDYGVIITPIDFDGSPNSNAFTVTRVTRAPDAFALLLLAAPGAGHSVTFNYLVTARP